MTRKFEVGTEVYVLLGGATAANAVAVRSISGTIIEESGKALKLQFDNGSRKDVMWLPKAALVGHPQRSNEYTLAKWFEPTSYQANVIERHQLISGISSN